MKEVYVSLPLIEATDTDVSRKDMYPGIGRYLVRLPNSDLLVVEVYCIPESGEGVNFCSIFIGQQKPLDEEDIMLKENADAVSEDYELQVKALKSQLEEQKAYYENRLKEQEERAKEQIDIRVAAKVERIEHEYEVKALKLEQDTPKRFGQGEWISGKTLKEIIALLAKDDSQKQAITGQNGQ